MDRLCRRGVLDLALMAKCERTPATAHRLGDEEFVVVLAAGHPQLAADRVELRALEGEPWVRFDRDSALDGVLLEASRDDGLTPATVARVSQTATAVRWAAHGLGVTLVPASAVPRGYEHLARPVFPAVSQPVIAVVQSDSGPAATALLELLRQEIWDSSASFHRSGAGEPHDEGAAVNAGEGAAVNAGEQLVLSGDRTFRRAFDDGAGPLRAG
jgi:DNA-binding transcriptional LysR family regulator